MAFIFGVLATFFAFIIQIFVWVFHPDIFTLSTPFTPVILFSLFFLAFSEELARTLFVRQYLILYAKNHLVWAAIFFGIGFTVLEIILTYWNGFSVKILGAASLHLVATFMTFWWLQQSRNRTSFIALLLLLTAMHVTFNLVMLSAFSV